MKSLVGRCVYVAALLALTGHAWAASTAAKGTRARAATVTVKAADPDPRDAAADAAAARFCPDVDFVAYSKLEPSGQKIEESVVWQPLQKTYLIRGPRLTDMLDDPGVERIPGADTAAQASFRIAIRGSLSRPVDRFCQSAFQEQAECDPSGTIIYTQIYTGCDLQRIRHITRITPDHAGSLQLLKLSFSDVQGNFSAPLYLSAGSDLWLVH